jgi:hypothetical protein
MYSSTPCTRSRGAITACNTPKLVVYDRDLTEIQKTERKSRNLHFAPLLSVYARLLRPLPLLLLSAIWIVSASDSYLQALH